MLLHKRILPYEIDVPLLPLHLFAQLSIQHFNHSLKETTHKNIFPQCKTHLYKILEMKQVSS
jgi:hypothetical protein